MSGILKGGEVKFGCYALELALSESRKLHNKPLKHFNSSHYMKYIKKKLCMLYDEFNKLAEKV